MTSKATPLHADMFSADGRGPDLQRICWSGHGTRLDAIEYFNPDDVYEAAALKHVRFAGVQVVQITPEEVINYADVGPASLPSPTAGICDLGQSRWLASFDQRHLGKCSHFRLRFYDELVDVICESVTCHQGSFGGHAAG